MKRIVIGATLCLTLLCMAILSWTMEESGEDRGSASAERSPKRQKVEARGGDSDLAASPVMEDMRNGGYKKLAIPVEYLRAVVGENGITPEGKIEEKELFLNMHASDPLAAESYNELLEGKNGLPLLVGLVTTINAAGRYIHNVYEASLLCPLIKEGRKIGLFKDPVNRLEVKRVVLFYMLPKNGEQFICVGPDRKWLDGELPLLNLIIDANDGDSDAQRKLGAFYANQKNYRQAEPYLKAAVLAGNSSARKNLISLYLIEARLNEAEPYLIQAADDGDVIAQKNLIVLYIEQNKFAQAQQCLEDFPVAQNRERLVRLLAERRAALAMKG